MLTLKDYDKVKDHLAYTSLEIEDLEGKLTQTIKKLRRARKLRRLLVATLELLEKDT